MISREEQLAAQQVSALMDSVAAGDRERNVKIVKDSVALHPVMILLLASVLHESEILEDGLVEANRRLKRQLAQALDEGTKFAEAYNVQRAKVRELRDILDHRGRVAA